MDIQTVCGSIDSAELGVTLIHEHLFVGYQGWELDADYLYDPASLVSEAVRRLIALRQCGVRTFVDPCPIELGRDVNLMREISEKSGMQIICTTGFYFEEQGLPIYWRMRTEDEIAEFLIREIEQGIGTSGVRPGAIKCATGGQTPTALERKFLAAAAKAHRVSGLPLITHTQDGIGGPEQQELFHDHDVPLDRCLIGHCCGNPDPRYHRQILDRGSYLGFDRIGYTKFQKDEVRADNLALLIDEGYGDKILISQDRYCAFLGKSLAPPTKDEAERVALLKAEGLWPPAHTYLFTDFFPRLRERGVDDSVIEKMLVENTRRFLEAGRVPEGAQ